MDGPPSLLLYAREGPLILQVLVRLVNVTVISFYVTFITNTEEAQKRKGVE